jgi:hypothetical protein
LSVGFVDGLAGTIDLSALIVFSEAGVFARMRDLALFNQVYLELARPGGGELDLAPDATHAAIKAHGEWRMAP